MSRDDALRRLQGQIAQARVDARYLLERAREQARADVASAQRTADDDLFKERRSVREAFRKELDAVRSEIHGLSSSAGLALAPWSDPGWGTLDAAAGDPATAAATALAIGEINAFPYDASEDTLRLPATLVPEQTGAVLLNASRLALERVRGALLGWCVRLLAHAGPGAVSIVWFDRGKTDVPVPAEWRPASGEPSVIETYHREALARSERGTGHVAPAFGSPATAAPRVRTVLVAIGTEAERVPDLGPWLARCAASAYHGVHVLVAPTRPPRGVEGDVIVLDDSDHRGRMRTDDATLGKHELILQEPPSAEVVQRVSAWSAPFGPFASGDATPAADPAPAGDAGAPVDPVDAVDRVPAADDADRSPSERASGSVGLDTEYLRALLEAAPPDAPQLTIALDPRGAPLRVPLSGPLLVSGVDLAAAAAMVATHLVEVACQASTATLEFAVLDTSDDPIVADCIDAVVDHVPHLVDVSQGIGALVACDAILARIARSARGDATLALFVIATSPLPERLVTPLTRILHDGPKARVMPCVWALDAAAEAHAPADATTLRVRDGGATLHMGGEREVAVTMPSPLRSQDVEAIADVLRRVRS